MKSVESTADFKARLAAQACGEPVVGAQRAHPCVVRTSRDARTPAEVMAFGKRKVSRGRTMKITTAQHNSFGELVRRCQRSAARR